MSTVIKGKSDSAVRSLKAALDAYEVAHPLSKATLYRSNAASIRLRVIDRRFETMPKARRHTEVWKFLSSRVPEDTLSEVSLVLALAPAEVKTSLMNMDFEDPVTSNS